MLATGDRRDDNEAYKEFKRETVRIALTSGLSQERVASDMGIGKLTLAERFAPIAVLLQQAAPMTADLTRRGAALPPLAALAAKARQDYGDAYCGGQIEQSLHTVLDTTKRA